MKIVNLDSEQAAILKDTAETAVRMLGYRMERADPDGILSKSHALQKLKINQVMAQLDLPSLPTWGAMPEERRAEILRLALLLVTPKHQKERGQIFEALFMQIMASREDVEQLEVLDSGRVPLDEEPPAPKDASPRARTLAHVSKVRS